MSDYPSLSSTTKKWESRSEKNRKHLADVLQTLLQCEVDGGSISAFLSALASRVDKDGDIYSLAGGRMKQNRKKRRTVDKGRLDPWKNRAKGELDESQRGLKSTAAYLEHGKVSAAAFSAFLAEAQKNQLDRHHRVGVCKERVTSLKETIRRLQEGIEAWDEG
jgi:hypothetical protein